MKSSLVSATNSKHAKTTLAKGPIKRCDWSLFDINHLFNMRNRRLMRSWTLRYVKSPRINPADINAVAACRGKVLQLPVWSRGCFLPFDFHSFQTLHSVFCCGPSTAINHLYVSSVCAARLQQYVRMHRQIGNRDHCGEDLFLGPSGNLGVSQELEHSIFHCPLTVSEAFWIVSGALRPGNSHEPSPVNISSL